MRPNTQCQPRSVRYAWRAEPAPWRYRSSPSLWRSAVFFVVSSKAPCITSPAGTQGAARRMTTPQRGQRRWERGHPRNPSHGEQCCTVVAPVSHREGVIVWRSVAKAQPPARSAKLCHAGAVNRPCNTSMTNVPHDDTQKVPTAMSSQQTVCMSNGPSYRSCDCRGTIELRLALTPCDANRETND